MTAASPLPTEFDPEIEIPASRIMLERNEAQADVQRLRAEKTDLLGQLATVCLERDRLVRENTRLLERFEAAQKRLDLWIDDALKNLDRSTLRDVAEGPLGIDCPECEDGRVETFEDIMVGGEHSTRDYTVECEHCNATGRCLR